MSEETKRPPEPGWDTTQILELSDRDFRRAMMKALIFLMGKVDNM